MPTKQTAQNIFLWVSAAVILFGVVYGLAGGGRFHFGALKTFTYQSNVLLGLGFLVMPLVKGRGLRQYIFVAVMLAAVVTGLVYNFLLVPFAGAPLFFFDYVNFSTHVLVTVLPLVNYFAFEQRGQLGLRHVLVGSLFPVVYWMVFVAIGERIDFFPYFFMNPNIVGWGMVFVWFAGLLAVFVGLGLLLLLYDKRK